MAAPPTSAPLDAQKGTGPPVPKLRDSCHACSASKVKCSRQKPSCARCTKRGLACEYLATRRAGRKHDSRPSRSDTNTSRSAGSGIQGASNPTANSSSSSSVAGNLTPSSSCIGPPFDGQHTSGYQDILPDFFSSAEQSLGSDFNDFIASPISFPGQENSEGDGTAPHYLFPEGASTEISESHLAAAFLRPEDAFSIMDEAVSGPTPRSRPNSPPHSQCSTVVANDAQMLHDIHSGSSTTGCLVNALGLLKQLFPNASTGCARSKTPEDSASSARHLPTIQSAVLENAQTIDAISNMLQCPCSQDDYLLMVMSLVVFKVLGWYAAAARGAPAATRDNNQSPSQWGERKSSRHMEQVLQMPAVVGGYRIDGEDQARMAGQLVLSELHRAQHLVNLLSERLKKHGMRNGSMFSTPDSMICGQETQLDEESPSPFSSTLLDQLESDVRKRLRCLSSEIVSMLRHG